MSSERVFAESLRMIRELNIAAPALPDVVATLEAGRPGPLDLLYEAGFAAELPPARLFARAAAIYFTYCAGNLADDLVAGSCAYLAQPLRHGPGIQYLLQNAFVTTAAKAALNPGILKMVSTELALSAAHHQAEVRVSSWTAPQYRELAEGIAGRQYGAYLSLLWSGTELSAIAAELGMALAVPSRVAADLHTKARRLFSLNESDRRAIVAWAGQQLERAASFGLRFVSERLPALQQAFGEAG